MTLKDIQAVETNWIKVSQFLHSPKQQLKIYQTVHLSCKHIHSKNKEQFLWRTFTSRTNNI